VVDKFHDRRDELATAALATLLERGYANTSLRDIAAQSDFSHGVLHYYFEDKLDLIAYCAGFYEERLGLRHLRLRSGEPTTPEQLLDLLVKEMRVSLAEEFEQHRLWYDLRAQSMFEVRLHEPVRRVESARQALLMDIATRYAALGGFRLVVDGDTAYALMDGLLQTCLRRYVAGEKGILTSLPSMVEALMAMLVGQVPAVALPEDTFDDLVG
jgi:TetR/AcrR family transcriptional repressor of bet genes